MEIQNLEKQTNKYIFPNFLAKAMAKVDLRTQYEASMMSMSLMMVGIFVSVIYMFFFLDILLLWYKIFLVINGIAGLLFMSSYLVTTFQQYQTYMAAMEFNLPKEMKGGP